MIKKNNPGKEDLLAARMRKVTAAPEGEVAYTSATTGLKRHERKPTFKAATLTCITGERIDVVVKNVSETGARVDFLRDLTLPDRVLLSEPTMQLKIWAYVVWQTRGAAGLQFVRT